jgi:hypothetical protein
LIFQVSNWPIHAVVETATQSDRQACRHAGIQTDRQTDKKACGQSVNYRQTGMQTVSQLVRRTGKHAVSQ